MTVAFFFTKTDKVKGYKIVKCKEMNNIKVTNARGATRRIPWENILDRPNLMQREITATCILSEPNKPHVFRD
jgi:hypothetical protein